jgi:hypothetical protein
MLDKLIIHKTLRVPAVVDGLTPRGQARSQESAAVARQMDSVLVRAGFKATGKLLTHISELEPGAAWSRALVVIGAVRELVGDHVAHNVYFIDFPRNVPDTMEFWLSSMRGALAGSRVGTDGGVPTDAELMEHVNSQWFNLLDLPNYGRYQHSYEEMLARHDELLPSFKDRATLLDLGGTVDEESAELYRTLAASSVPIGESLRPVLELLSATCIDARQPDTIPVRENRAIVNAVRLAAHRELIGVDTVTDVLRLACQVSDGDVTLAQPTRFRSFSPAERRVLLAALEAVVAESPAKLGDVPRYAERWKRLDEGLHSGDYATRFPHARDVFAVARGEREARSMAGKVELAFATGNVPLATQRLATAPGMLVRSLDRILRSASTQQLPEALDTLAGAVDRVSGRVLLSAREHLDNRTQPDLKRVFANRHRRAWVTDDTRPALDPALIGQAGAVLDDELLRRLPACEHLVVDPEVLGVALPLSGNATEDGFDVMPRGSVTPLDGETLRLFTYWRQHTSRTDFDLSALFLDDEMHLRGQVSYTNYHFGDGVHSGDVTDASRGASEFIDIQLATCPTPFVMAQVNVYSGEGFNEVAESMIGYMLRDSAQRGAPFEPKTVRTRSAMRGENRVAVPFAFRRTAAGGWECKWLHLYLKGNPLFNRVEGNHLSTALVARAILDKQYLTVDYLVRLWSRKAKTVVEYNSDMTLEGPVTYVGLRAPERELPENSTAITLATLNQLVPE